MAYIGEEFQKRFKTLPQDIQEALTAVASVDTIFAIGKKHGLMVDQIGKMADEIWKVMLGLANPKDFIRNLASTLGIESEKASAIASEVNAQMFQPVRESLRRLYDEAPQQAAGSMQQAQQQEHFQQQDKKPAASYQIPATSPQVPPMIYPHTKEFGVGVYPQEGFEEPQMSDLEGRTKQLAPLPPMVPQPSPPPPLPPKDDDFTYPEKMKDVSRESIKGREYQGKDPYRESIE